MEFDHEQVPYTTYNGVATHVDAGMYDVLVQLRRLGVETQYSCQDNHDLAYVCMRGRRARRVVRYFSRQQYTCYELQFAVFRNGGRRLMWQRDFRRGKNAFYVVEETYSKQYGYRFTLRWPHEDTDRVLAIFSSL